MQDLCLTKGGPQGLESKNSPLRAKAEGECKEACRGSSFEGCKDVPEAPVCKACKACLNSDSHGLRQLMQLRVDTMSYEEKLLEC